MLYTKNSANMIDENDIKNALKNEKDVELGTDFMDNLMAKVELEKKYAKKPYQSILFPLIFSLCFSFLVFILFSIDFGSFVLDFYWISGGDWLMKDMLMLISSVSAIPFFIWIDQQALHIKGT